MRKRGFTLIELLIVVAIIAILAAIAVPNFLEAQTRSKVSRAEADMRNLATALESYFVDHNHYPWPFPRPSMYATNVPNELSTPVAYISSVSSFFDPFSVRLKGMYGGRYNRYGYVTANYGNALYYYQILKPEYKKAIGMWRLDSFGPDGRSGPKGGPSNYPNEVTYDPSNGTVSRGDIYRSQRDSEGLQP
ncbi:prepilin-type N-terminal cleavage/methylation domain-containing protein [Candidatus Sumerlaeota bacterium]|nr:prepilin-type N-terminal cleavage/methylation domain-containing protein [Candidatus Sumerlaeota bacterium]